MGETERPGLRQKAPSVLQRKGLAEEQEELVRGKLELVNDIRDKDDFVLKRASAGDFGRALNAGVEGGKKKTMVEIGQVRSRLVKITQDCSRLVEVVGRDLE